MKNSALHSFILRPVVAALGSAGCGLRPGHAAVHRACAALHARTAQGQGTGPARGAGDQRRQDRVGAVRGRHAQHRR